MTSQTSLISQYGKPVNGFSGEKLSQNNQQINYSTNNVGNNNPYPFYETSTYDLVYNRKCFENADLRPGECKKELISNITFTISGNYTISGDKITKSLSSDCIITMTFKGEVLTYSTGTTTSTRPTTSTEKITIPQGTVISESGITTYKTYMLNDLSTTKLTIKITFTIRNAEINNAGRLAELDISFDRNYNHLTSTTTTPRIAGYTDYAPGQFSTNLSSLKGTISGTSGTFNSAITFTSTPVFTHIVYPSL